MIKRLKADEEDARDYLHDIAKPISDIQPLARTSSDDTTSQQQAPDIFLGKRPYVVRHDSLPQRGRSHPLKGMWIYGAVTCILLVIMLFVTSYVFGRAHIDITPYVVRGNVDTIMSAYQEVQAGITGIPFETMSFKRTLSKIVESDGFDESTATASGTLMIYNNETKAQTFKEETRFKTKAGLIYKLGKGSGITVPAAVNGVPGSIEAVVYAEKPGPEYNGEKTDLVIAGWEETKDPRVTTQYARSKTAFEGGVIRKQPRVSTELLASIVTESKKILTEQVMAQAVVEVPKGFTFFPGALTITFDEPVIEAMPEVEGQARVTLVAHAHAYLFPEDKLARALIQYLDPLIVGDTTRFGISEASALDIGISPQNQGDATQSDTKSGTTVPAILRFRIQGKAELMSDVDTDTLKKELVGKTIKEVGTVFEKVPEIGRAALSIRPLWRTHIPKNVNYIIISQEIEA